MSLYADFECRAAATRQNVKGGFDLTSMLAAICLIVSGSFWFPIQWKLTTPTTQADQLIALSMGAFLVLAPPIITSLFVPWSRVGRLLQQMHLTGVGRVLGIGVGLFLLWYAWQLTAAYWAARPVIEQAGLEVVQTLVGIIATIGVPALLWAPTSREELAEKMKTDYMITQYEEAQKARLRDLRLRELKMIRLANIGFADLTSKQRDDLAHYQLDIVKGIDRVLSEIANDAAELAGLSDRYSGVLKIDDTITDNLDYVTQSLRGLLPEPQPTGATTVSNVPVTGVPLGSEASQYSASESVGTRYAETTLEDPGRSRNGTRPPNMEALSVVREHFGLGYWTANNAAEVLAVDKNTAERMIGEWVTAEVVQKASLRGRYQIAEGGMA